MTTGVIVQARLGSTRLPKKVLKYLGGKPVIDLVLSRLRLAKSIQKIIVAIPDSKENDELEIFLKGKSVNIYRGSEQDVLDRFFNAARQYDLSTVIRITADCPFVDPYLLDEMVSHFFDSGVDYLSNRLPPTFPDGLDIEIFSIKALMRAHREADQEFDREHVTPFIYGDNGFCLSNFSSGADYSYLRWTIDEQEDLELAEKLFQEMNYDIGFCWRDALLQPSSRRASHLKNPHRSWNEGAKMTLGQKKWRRATQIVSGGTGLYSKRPNLHLPNQWPTYFSKAEGCDVWDLEGRLFKDCYLMGVGTNVLGYSHAEVDTAVIDCIKKGNLSTFSPVEEVDLAEKLIELNRWAKSVKFARSGGGGKCNRNQNCACCYRKGWCGYLWLPWMARLVPFGEL